MNTKVKNYFSPKRIAYLGVMTAIAVITNCFSITVNSGANSISFNYVICSLAGIFFGPVSGGIVGLLGDLIGCLIAPKGPFNPFIMIASGLIGVLSGLAFMLPKLNVYLKIIIAYVFIFVVCTLGLNTFGLWFFYAKGKKSFLIYLAGRAPFQAINIAINVVITYVLYIPLKKFVFDKWDVSGKKAIKATVESTKTEESSEKEEK
ncbi:MAG: folate family ECF transporter S component [Clostridia bacterium]|nr:folate family ECF transporter S component [Clostridia bacterium]